MTDKIKVLHIITRLIIGGAQENTVYTVHGLRANKNYEAALASGQTFGPEGSMEKEIKSCGINIIPIPCLRRNINPLYDFIAFWHIFFIIKKGSYDIVHTHSSKAGFLGRLAAKLAGVKLVIHTIHGLPFHPYQSKVINYIYRSCEKFAACFTDKIIAVSKAMVDQALRAGISLKEKFIVIYSGLDLEQFKPQQKNEDLRKQFGISENEIVIGKVARLFHLKGHGYLLKAVSNLISYFPHLKILLVGDGILRHEIEAEAEELGLKDKVIFAGLVHREKIPEMIAVMDIVVHCSLREGLARVIPQAMAMGKPVVGFDLDGSREVIQDGVNGFLVKPENVEDLTNTLKKLLSNPSHIKDMGAMGRKKIIPYFDKDYMVNEIEKVYEEFLK